MEVVGDIHSESELRAERSTEVDGVRTRRERREHQIIPVRYDWEYGARDTWETNAPSRLEPLGTRMRNVGDVARKAKRWCKATPSMVA